MKTKNFLKLIAILIAVVSLNFASCKKDKTTDQTTPDTSSLQQLSKDDAQVQATDDEISNDANGVLTSSSKSMKIKDMDSTAINSCTVTIDTVGTNLVITLVYNGFNTGHSFSRTGTVVITKPLGIQWKTAGCVVTLQYVNLAVTKIASGKTFTYNGTRTWTNVSGGRIIDLGTTSATSVTFTITGNMTIMFDDGTTRVWTISRQHIWTGTYPNNLSVSVTGFGSNSGYNNLVEYGLNRKGEQFYTQINTAILYSNTCVSYQWTPIWGVLIHQIPSVPKSATITFGYNSSDNLVTIGDCANYFRMDWVVKTYSGTIYLSIP
jgi:hypothetical protein